MKIDVTMIQEICKDDSLVISILREEGYFTPKDDVHELLAISRKRLEELADRLPEIKKEIDWTKDFKWVAM